MIRPAASRIVARLMATRRAAARRYWLFKSEPDTYSFAHLQADGRTFWHGVRNYQARNLLRDEIQVDDGVLFYHSNASPPALVGVAKVVRAGYPDATAFDPASDYHDPKSNPQDPTWFQVDIAPVQPFRRPLPLPELRAMPELEDMVLLQRSRLSVQPVTREQWRHLLAAGGAVEAW
jgi:predicted RNA-binding protein with PUA-like domain